jgi:hypothetical protein
MNLSAMLFLAPDRFRAFTISEPSLWSSPCAPHPSEVLKFSMSMSHRILRTLAVIGLSTIVLPAIAQSPSADSAGVEKDVTLQDGTGYRGQVVEYRVQDHISLRLASGEVKRIPWSQIRHVAEARPDEPPPPIPGSATPEPSGSAQPQPVAPIGAAPLIARPVPSHPEVALNETVLVELKADNPEARLFRQVTPGLRPVDGVNGERLGDGWEEVCVQPCRMRLDPRFRYQVAGTGISGSSFFQLPASGSSVRLDVSTTSIAKRVTGWVLFAPGAGAAVLGILYLATANSTKPETAEEPEGSSRVGGSCKTPACTREVGAALLIGGAAVATVGLILATSKTKVTLKPSSAGIASWTLAPGIELTPHGIVF